MSFFERKEVEGVCGFEEPDKIVNDKRFDDLLSLVWI